jgi:hypothetical protein
MKLIDWDDELLDQDSLGQDSISQDKGKKSSTTPAPAPEWPPKPKPPKIKNRTLAEEIEAHELSPETIQNLDPSIQLIYEKDEFFDEEEKPYVAIMCPYRGVPREIHPEVCRYHNEMKDPECHSCKRYKGDK